MCDLGLVVEKLDLQPGDVVALRSSRRLTAEQADEIHQRWKRAVGAAGQHVAFVVLGEGMELARVRPEAEVPDA